MRTSLCQDEFESTLLRLDLALRSAKHFMAYSGDVKSQVIIEEDFKALRGEIVNFAKYQYGIGITEAEKVKGRKK